MISNVLDLDGRCYVVLPQEEYRRLLLGKGLTEMPPLPPAMADGSRDAVAYARASIARSIIQERVALGLTQQKLAALAGISPALARIESGKHKPSVKTATKIDAALKRAASRMGMGGTF